MGDVKTFAAAEPGIVPYVVKCAKRCLAGEKGVLSSCGLEDPVLTYPAYDSKTKIERDGWGEPSRLDAWRWGGPARLEAWGWDGPSHPGLCEDNDVLMGA